MRKRWVYYHSGDGLPMVGLDRGLVMGSGKREREEDMFTEISTPVFYQELLFVLREFYKKEN